MSILDSKFNKIAAKRSAKYPPPFSLRLTFEERARLDMLRGNMPLGQYIREQLLGDDAAPRKRRVTMSRFEGRDSMNALDPGPQTYVVTMSASAYRAAQELEVRCERLGLDRYDEAALHLMAAGKPAEKELWGEVWEYIQLRECIGWNDRILVDLK